LVRREKGEREEEQGRAGFWNEFLLDVLNGGGWKKGRTNKLLLVGPRDLPQKGRERKREGERRERGRRREDGGEREEGKRLASRGRAIPFFSFLRRRQN